MSAKSRKARDPEHEYFQKTQLMEILKSGTPYAQHVYLDILDVYIHAAHRDRGWTKSGVIEKIDSTRFVRDVKRWEINLVNLFSSAARALGSTPEIVRALVEKRHDLKSFLDMDRTVYNFVCYQLDRVSCGEDPYWAIEQDSPPPVQVQNIHLN